MMVMILALAMAAPNPRALDIPRKAYSTCIKGFESRSLAAKLDPAAYSTALKGACTAEAAALARALVAFDMAMGGKRASATASANSDVADYVLSSEERYRDMLPPAKSQ